jgi:hypothetical protein
VQPDRGAQLLIVLTGIELPTQRARQVKQSALVPPNLIR